MRKLSLLFGALLVVAPVLEGTALADGPSGSTECQLQDDDCDTLIDEDQPGDVDGDGNPDDDGDGLVDEDPVGDAADDPGENQVACATGSQNVGGLFSLYAASNGAEACADDGAQLPVDGRVIVTTEQGGYVAVDGDNSNTAPANGYARIDQSGIHCGDDANQDSTAGDQSGNTSADCG